MKKGKRIESSGNNIPPKVSLCSIKNIPQTIKVPKILKVVKAVKEKVLAFALAKEKTSKSKGRTKNIPTTS